MIDILEIYYDDNNTKGKGWNRAILEGNFCVLPELSSYQSEVNCGTRHIVMPKVTTKEKNNNFKCHFKINKTRRCSKNICFIKKKARTE